MLSSLNDFLCSEERCLNMVNVPAADASLPLLPRDINLSGVSNDQSELKGGNSEYIELR